MRKLLNTNSNVENLPFFRIPVPLHVLLQIVDFFLHRKKSLL
jgi:hypothetical protein